MEQLAQSALQDLHQRRPGTNARIQNERQGWSWRRNLVANILESTMYECLLAIVIVTNAIVIIHETDRRAADKEIDMHTVTSRFIFLPLYGLELIVRLYVYRRRFLDTKWNILDVTVVGIDLLVEMVDLIVKDATEEVPSLSLLRVLRLCRLARFARVMVIFKELHMMLHAFLSAMKTMFWACFMLAVLLTFFSILAVEIVHPVNKRLAEAGAYGEDCGRCARAFSTVMEANLTFMQQIIAGDSWGKLSVPIIEESPQTAIILVTALVMINLGVLNLILTVIVNAAHEARANDKRLQAEENCQRFDAHKRTLLKICSALDTNSDGVLSLEELTAACDFHEEFRHICEALDIRKDEMETIYAFLDANQDGYVTYTEFVEQVFKIKQMDVHSFLITLRGVLNQINQEMQRSLQEIKAEVGASHAGNSITRSPPSPQLPPGGTLAVPPGLRNGQTVSSDALQALFKSNEHLSVNGLSAGAANGNNEYSARPDAGFRRAVGDAEDAIATLSGSGGGKATTTGSPRLAQNQNQHGLHGLPDGRKSHILRMRCWHEVDQELSSLRHRLDEDLANFVVAMLGRIDKQTKDMLSGMSDDTKCEPGINQSSPLASLDVSAKPTEPIYITVRDVSCPDISIHGDSPLLPRKSPSAEQFKYPPRGASQGSHLSSGSRRTERL